ncbi:MAG: type IV toxin-antitoxin system AbiEi family antitoxin [Coriobacteriia bacterium]|nr:type IV toxin-antitoxin system AbiEi family antitoxin [Coriobacteriia bacterium]
MAYTPNIANGDPPSGIERSLGPTQARLLLKLAERFGASFTAEQAHGDPSIQDPHLKGRLNDLVTKGWLFSLGRGAYMIAPLEAGPDSSSYAINRYLAAATIAGDRDYYLSYRTAMELHGMTLHPWRSVYLSTASRLRAREIQHFSIQPVTVAPERLWGTVTIEVIPDHRVNVSSRARTIVDCIDRPGYAGGLADVALGLTLLGDDFIATDAVDAAVRYGRVSVMKRLGVLIELLAPQQRAAVEPLLSRVDRTPHVLNPQSPRGGRLNSRWGIWMNISEDELLQETVS